MLNVQKMKSWKLWLCWETNKNNIHLAVDVVLNN